MKVALIAPGIWRSVHWDFAQAAKRLGHEVVVYTEDASAPSGRTLLRLERDGIQCFVIHDTRRNPLTWLADRLAKPLLGRRFFTTLSAVRRFLRRVADADLRMVESDWMGVFVALAVGTERQGRRPARWIVSIHDTLYLRAPIDYPGRPQSAWRERVKLWVLGRASAVRANSHVTREALIAGGCPPAKIFVAPLPVARWMQLPESESLMAFRERASREVRARWGVAPEAPLYVTMCRLDPAKGLELAVEALAHCSDARARLLVCGGDRQVVGLGSYRERLLRIAGREGVEGRVIFAGDVPVDEVKRYLAAAEVHLAPSVIDTFNYAVVEAAIVGTPSLMSDRVGAGPWIVEAGGGEMIGGRDADRWAQAMEALAHRPLTVAERLAMSEAIRRTLSPESVARAVIAGVDTLRFPG